MIHTLGYSSLAISLVLSLYGVVAAVVGVRRRRPELIQSAMTAAYVIFGLLTVANLTMIYALVTNDFSVSYVAQVGSRSTPLFITVVSLWSALEGSILFWGWVLSGYTAVAVYLNRRHPGTLVPYATATMLAVGVFFYILLTGPANPFGQVWPVPSDGPGPNPLLQNHILMAVHPPLLYLGYVGLTVPFAFAVGALLSGRLDDSWIQLTRKWTVTAWGFLSVAIIAGMWWSYEVLGWGGYWAWDPVENASLMPWLVATAFIHSSLVQQRRGMLQAWNFVLVISAFALTILGTFLTRSGTITSVHSFTQSAIGPVLLGFLVLVLAGSFALFATRSHLVASAPRLDSFWSREGSFLANNLILTVFASVVLVGTIYPLVLEAFTGTQVGVGKPFYNRLTVPLSFALLLTMGLGSVTPWRHAAGPLVWNRIRGPLQVALAAGLVTAVIGTRLGWVVLAVVASVFVIGVIVRHLTELAGRRSRATGRGFFTEALHVLRGDQGYWAGQVSHVGVALVALGLAFTSNLSVHETFELEPGDTFAFAGYEMTYRAPFQRTEPSRTVVGANIEVHSDGRLVAELQPRANHFGSDPTGIPSPAVMSRLSGDVYLMLINIDNTGIRLEANTSPLIWLLWVGGLVTAAGGFWATQARRAERRTTALEAADA